MTYNDLIDVLLLDEPSVYIKNHEDLIFNLIPELKLCKGCKQNTTWHIYDVYDHILKAVDSISNNRILRIAALFHDLGKVNSKVTDEENIDHFPNHFKYSRDIFLKYKDKFNLSDDDSLLIENLILYHDLRLRKTSLKELESILQVLKLSGVYLLYELKKADLLAQNPKYLYLLDSYKVELDSIESYIKEKRSDLNDRD